LSTSFNIEAKPPGLSLLRFFYITGVAFYCLSVLIFHRYTEVSLLSNRIGPLWGTLVYVALFLIPLYIFLDLKKPNVRVFWVILLYHLLFIANTVISIINLALKNVSISPIIEIVEKPELYVSTAGDSFTWTKLTVHILSMLVGLVIIIYVMSVKHVFLKK
jgi:hypothetical protein